MISILTLAPALLFSIVLVRLLRTGRRPKGLPPGPPTVPVLGNIHLMPDRDIHLQFQKWAEEYGPIYSIIMGTKTVIVLSSAEAVRDLMDKRSAIYSSRQDHYLGQTVISEGNRMLMMPYGPTWRMIRKMVHNLLNIQKSTSYVSYQDLENKQMLCELLDQPDQFLDALRRYTMSLMTSIVYGFRTTRSDDPRLAKVFKLLENLTETVQSAAAALLEVFPILQNLPDALVPMKRFAREAHKFEYKLFMTLWNDAKSASEKQKAKPCFCTDMIKVQETEGFTDDIAAYLAGTMIEAGADTTSNTLYAFIQAMVLFPEVQKKAQEELDRGIGPNRLPDMDDYARLPYIVCCVKEAVRWMPTAVLGFPHAVTQDDEYMGYRIPKGAGVFENVYTLNRDPKRYPSPDRFEPDRYKDDSENNLAESSTNSDPEKRGSFGFGAGRRICQGMHVAERSMFLAMSRILWGFDITPAKDEKGQDILPDPDKLTQGFVCMPEPFEATIRPRSSERAKLIRETWDNAQKELDSETKQWR